MQSQYPILKLNQVNFEYNSYARALSDMDLLLDGKQGLGGQSWEDWVG